MKKANAVPGREKKVPTKLSLSEEDRKRLAYAYADKETPQQIAAVVEHWNDQIRYLHNEINRYEESVVSAETELAKQQARMDAASTDTGETEVQKLMAELEQVARLAWVEEVSVGSGGDLIEITTRSGLLKTRLEERHVFAPLVDGTVEMNDPVPVVSLPKLKIAVSLRQVALGQQPWANNPSVFALKLADPKEYGQKLPAHVASAGYGPSPAPHWACPSGVGYKKVCLGEYEQDFYDAAKKGIAPLLEQVAVFLQTSGWEHAYLRKWKWAMLLGNPAYNQYASRLASEDENIQEIQRRHQRDVRATQQPEQTIVVSHTSFTDAISRGQLLNAQMMETLVESYNPFNGEADFQSL